MKHLWSIDKDVQTLSSQMTYDTYYHGDSPEFIAFNMEKVAIELVVEMIRHGHRNMAISVSDPEHSTNHRDVVIAQGIPNELERVMEYVYEIEMENRILRKFRDDNSMMPVCTRKHVEDE